MHRVMLLCVGIVVALQSLESVAQETLNFYRATIPVRSQDDKERQYAAQKGIQEVIQRMSGSETVLENPQIQIAIGNAQRYIEQFQYLAGEDSELIDRGYTLQLSMIFSSSVIRRIITESGEPYWPENRPTTLVWAPPGWGVFRTDDPLRNEV